MENLKRMVVRIAYTPDDRITTLSPLHRCLLPFLTAASYLYEFALQARKKLYLWGLFKHKRLAVPVISVGNLTWGGNGKTPMTEFLAFLFSEAGIPPLILTRGYAGGDEGRMLQRHLIGTTTKIGLGPNRSNIAADFFQRYGVMEFHRRGDMAEHNCQFKESEVSAKKIGDGIGVVILDDGMQHWSLSRDLEIVMVNCITLWGNRRLIPRGPLRESLIALKRADIIILHHTDLISKEKFQYITAMLECVLEEEIPIFGSRMVPCYFFRLQCQASMIPLNIVQNMVVLCVSGIGCPESLSLTMQELGAAQVDRVDFSDHHIFQDKDLQIVQKKLQKWKDEFGKRATIVLTEKDYERSQPVFMKLEAAEVLVLHSTLGIVSCSRSTEARFKTLLLNKVMHQWCSNVRTCSSH